MQALILLRYATAEGFSLASTAAYNNTFFALLVKTWNLHIKTFPKSVVVI
jgi:hypothetical protein